MWAARPVLADRVWQVPSVAGSVTGSAEMALANLWRHPGVPTYTDDGGPPSR
jgi:hypothetical protein